MTDACRRCRLKNPDRALFCLGCGAFLGAGKLDLQRFRVAWAGIVLLATLPFVADRPPDAVTLAASSPLATPAPTPLPWLRRDGSHFVLDAALAGLGRSPAPLLPGILVFPLEQSDGSIAPDGLLVAEMAMFHTIHRPRKRRALEFERVLGAFEEAGLHGEHPPGLADEKVRLRLLSRLKLQHHVLGTVTPSPGGRKVHLMVHAPEGNREFTRIFAADEARFLPAWIVHVVDDPWARPGEEIAVRDLLYPPQITAESYALASVLCRRTGDPVEEAAEWKRLWDHDPASAFLLSRYLRLSSRTRGREVVAALEKGNTLFPDHHHVRSVTARWLAGVGRYHTSLRITLELLDEDRLDAGLHRTLRESLVRLGRHDAAREVLTRAAGWNPRAAWAQLELGILAIGRARRALDGASGAGFLEGSNEARRHLQRAYNLDPGEEEACLWMIRALTGVPGTGPEMEVWFARGRSLDPSSEALLEAREAFLRTAQRP